MRYDFYGITSLAYMSLVSTGVVELPIKISDIKFDDILINSFQHYSKLTGIPVDELTDGREFDDGIYSRKLRAGVKLILYNKEKIDSRTKHTLWHEVGHDKCKHIRHAEREEKEAHFFATQANAPNAIIKLLRARGYTISKEFIIRCFDISEESANKKMKYLRSYPDIHKNECDDIVLLQFQDFLNSKYPPIARVQADNYFDKMEEQRANWY